MTSTRTRTTTSIHWRMAIFRLVVVVATMIGSACSFTSPSSSSAAAQQNLFLWKQQQQQQTPLRLASESASSVFITKKSSTLGRRQTRQPLFDYSSSRFSAVGHDAVADDEDDYLDPENNNNGSNRFRSFRSRATVARMMKSLQRRRRQSKSPSQWMNRVWQWQRRKRASVVATAALVVSLLLTDPISIATSSNNYNPQQQSPQPAAVERVVAAPFEHQHQQFSTAPRGGAFGGGGGKTDASSSTITKKKDKHMQIMVNEGVVKTGRTFNQAWQDLTAYMQGPKSDTLLLLLATALITPLCQRLGTSPILGFLASGMMLGPNGWGLISGIHTTETLAELGIVFFLFEMGIELSFDRLLTMRKDVFGLGLGQFSVTALAIAGVGALAGLPANANVVLGGGLALSSSAFVLQLLKDKQQLATRFGKAAFGILLFQDLAVVPLLVVTPILAGTGGGLATAMGSALLKATMALGAIAVCGRFVLNPLFKTVAQAKSQEAFLGVVLLTVLSMSFMTEGLGLSNTLGAFLAGVLLSETKYRYQVEADIAPFRGILLGLFFVTVGFEIDLALIWSQLPLVGSLVLGIMLLKATIATALSLMFGLSLATSQQTGLIISQGGEFAFVAFGLARNLGILDPATTKLLLTCASLTMALTPAMAALGSKISKRLEESSDFTHYLGQDRDANEIKESDDFAVVVGYGVVGKVVCDLLDRKFIKYVGLDLDPNKAIQARNQGLPVFYGDIGRQEVAEAFNVGKAKAVIVCIAEKSQASRCAIALRRWYPDLKIFCRAANADHAERLQSTLNVAAMVPILPEDNLLLTLPFGGAVMKSLGVPSEEVNAILESKRKEVLTGRGFEEAEEDMALLQLGVDVKEKKPNNVTEALLAATGGEDGSGGGGTRSGVLEDPEQLQNIEKAAREEAAAEIRAAKLEKSPFVAQVIEEVCPGSVCEDEECDEEDRGDDATTIDAEVLSLTAPEVVPKLGNETDAFQ